LLNDHFRFAFFEDDAGALLNDRRINAITTPEPACWRLAPRDTAVAATRI
jgi:hypothetical protein